MSGDALDPSLDRIVAAARDRRERRGATGDARFSVPTLSAEEALALDGLLTPRRPILSGRPIRLSLSVFEAALREQGLDPSREYERVRDGPVRDLPAERAAVRRRKDEFVAWLGEREVARARPAVGAWLTESARQGRLSAENQDLVARALRVLAVLPAEVQVQRTVLAAELLLGDPHALDVGTPLHSLVTSLLALVTGIDSDAAGQRAVWTAANVLVDPVSSSVTALNVPLVGDGVVARLVRAAAGSHVILTYGQLSADRLSWTDGVDCFSCENPSVLIAAERALGAECPPLVCTGGRPSDAVRLLFSAVSRSGGQIRHHGDFDEAGIQILRDLEHRYQAQPWRFDVEAWHACTRRLGGTASGASTPSTSQLESVVGDGSIPEELTLDWLLDDLGAWGRPP